MMRSPSSTPGTPNASITAAVMRTYGRDTSGVVSTKRRPFGKYGAMSMSAVRYWLLTSPRSCTSSSDHVDRALHGDRQVAGLLARACTCTPIDSSASCSGAIGRRRSGGSPSIVYGPGPERRERGDEPRRGAGETGAQA